MKPEYAYSEQSEGSQVIDIILTDGNKEKILEKDVIAFIEEYGLNVSATYIGNCSPKGDDDHCFDLYNEEIENPIKYLDDNFEYVCKLYYKHLIEKR